MNRHLRERLWTPASAGHSLKRVILRVSGLWVPGLVLGLYLNLRHIAILESTFHAATTWFCIGILYVLVGGMFCFGTYGGNNGFLYGMVVKTKQRLADGIDAEERLSRGLGAGVILLALGIGFILYSLHSAR